MAKIIGRKAYDHLSEIKVQADDAGIFCEKCIKLLIDCNDDVMRGNVLKMAEEKLDSGNADHEANLLLKQIGYHFEDAYKLDLKKVPLSDDLSGLIFSYISNP